MAVAVDDLSLYGLNESYRYTSSEDLSNFERRTVDNQNNVLSTVYPTLTVSGTGGKTFAQVDGGQFVTPLALNAIDPTRMVIAGATSIFESLDGGNTLTNLKAVPNAHALVYGGYQGLGVNLGVLWAASDAGVYLRTTAGGPLNKTNYAGGPALDIVTDPSDWTKAYVIDGNNQIWYTANQGGTWTDITGNYPVGDSLEALQFVPSGNLGTIVVGGLMGVYEMPVGQPGIWRQVDTGLPNAPVYSLYYDTTDKVLVAGTLGRGAWELQDVPDVLRNCAGRNVRRAEPGIRGHQRGHDVVGRYPERRAARTDPLLQPRPDD